MKHILWLIALTITIDIISSHGYQQLEDVTAITQHKIKNFYQVPPTLDIKPFQLGGKMLNKDNLQGVPEEQISLLLKMAYPSMLERWYGKDNVTVTKEDLEQIDQMPEGVRKGLKFTVLSTDNSCVMSYEADCKNYYACKGCVLGCAICGFGFVGGTIWGMCSSMPLEIFFKILCLKIALPFTTAIPGGAVVGEVTSCVRNKCCVEKEIWESKSK